MIRDILKYLYWLSVLFRLYPVEGDSLVLVLGAVEENVSCSFQKLQDETGVSCTQSDILSYLIMTSTKIQSLILKLFSFSLPVKGSTKANWAAAMATRGHQKHKLQKTSVYLLIKYYSSFWGGIWVYYNGSHSNFISTTAESCHTHHSAALSLTQTLFLFTN